MPTTIRTWCQLLAHRCDGCAGACTCTCHEQASPHASSYWAARQPQHGPPR
jgi:hypothetical protein